MVTSGRCYVVPWRAFGRSAIITDADHGRRVVPLDEIARRVLATCEGVKTPRDHAITAWRRGSTGDPNALASAIANLVGSGLLAPFPPVVTPKPRLQLDRINTVVIVTANRPDRLRLCLDTLTHALRAFRHSLRAIVIDGSKKGMVRNAVRTIVTNANSAHVRCSYIGPEEARRVRSALRDAADETTLEFALTPGEIGANRNLALVLTAGRRFVAIDDDVVISPWAENDRTSGLRFGGHGEHRRWRFYSNRADALQVPTAVNGGSIDLLAEHEALLGHDLRTLVASAGENVDASSACSHQVKALLGRGMARVRTTSAGLAGDTARYCPDQLLLLGGAVADSFRGDQEIFRTALLHREVQRICPIPTIVHDAVCPSYCLGIDNTDLLPPFVPVGRNEDGVFGAMLSSIEPFACFGHLNCGILHDSERPSSYTSESAISAREVRLADYILAALRLVGRPIEDATAGDRLAFVQQGFSDLARLSLADFTAIVSSAIVETKRSQVVLLEEVAGPSPPSYWLERLGRYRSQLAENVSRASFFVPSDLTPGADPVFAFEQARRFVGAMATYLGVWPQVWASSARQGGIEALWRT